MRRAFYGGTVYTADKDRRVLSALVSEDDKIIYVGNEEGMKEFVNDDTEMNDIKGKTLMPSFIEGHNHFVAACNAEVGVNLAGLHEPEDYIKRCKEFLAEHPDTKILRGQGYLEASFPGIGPDRKLLDEVSTEIPIVLLPETLHSLWANTKAIEMAGITKDTPDPLNGKIEREEDGTPRGCFRELAQHCILDNIPEMTVEEYKKGILAYQDFAHSLGFNGSFDAWTDDVGRNGIEALKELDKENRLTMYMRGSYWMDPHKGPEQVKDIVEQRDRDNGGNLFKMNTVKFFVDGILESFSALFLDPYVHCPGYPEGWCGDRIWNDDNLKATLLEVEKAGLTAHFHAYCDGAVRQVLDAIEYVQSITGNRETRHGITHVCYVNMDDIPRFRELGVVAMLNSYWDQVDETFHINGPNIGEDRERHTFAQGSFYKEGVVVGNASDYPITAIPNPFVGIEMGMTRTAPDNYHPWITQWDDPFYHVPLWIEEKAERKDMIQSFTYNTAYANFLEKETGSLEVGKYADMLIADRDILTTPEEDVGTIRTEKLFFRGKAVFER